MSDFTAAAGWSSRYVERHWGISIGAPCRNWVPRIGYRPDTTFWSIDTEALLRITTILNALQYTLRTTQGRLIAALRRPPARRPTSHSFERSLVSAAIRATVLALVVAGLSSSPALSKGTSGGLRFTATFESFQKLSADPSATREQWVTVVRSFAAIHKAEPGVTGNRSLFLAGRACLALYRRSGRKQDLEEAIRHLNEFLRTNRHGLHRILGLQELKEAHLLKRRLTSKRVTVHRDGDNCPESRWGRLTERSGYRGTPPSSDHTAPRVLGHPPGAEPVNVGHVRPASPAAPQQTAATCRPVPQDRGPVVTSVGAAGSVAQTQTARLQVTAVQPIQSPESETPSGAMTGVPCTSASSCQPLYNCTGNPFFGKQRSVPQRFRPPPASASLPPPVIIDVPRANPPREVQVPKVTERIPEPSPAPGAVEAPTEPTPAPSLPEATPESPVITGTTPPSAVPRAGDGAAETPTLPPAEPERRLPPKGVVIVIDPGHGGRDPGAVSHDGTLKEKDVTLRIAGSVKKLLEARIPNATVELTRRADNSLAVQERTAFANSLNADLFISIHCNAAEDASSRGIETYYLSKASSSKAMASAARENGISPGKMSDIDATLLDLLITSKKVESVKLAESVHRSLFRAVSGTVPVKRDRGVKRAPFYVLLGAKMPAILIECGFINGRETEKLKKPSFLDTIAGGIAEGTIAYLQGLGDKI